MDRTKATILQVGTVDPKTGAATGWHFDGRGVVGGMDLGEKGEVHKICGWTIYELAYFALAKVKPPINGPEGG